MRTLRVRSAMLLVFVSALAIHLGVTAWRVGQDRPIHVHSGVIVQGGSPALAIITMRQPFFGAFWRGSLGLPQASRGLCNSDPVWLLEQCELDTPEIRIPLGPDNFAAYHSSEQRELFQRLMEAGSPPLAKPNQFWAKLIRTFEEQVAEGLARAGRSLSGEAHPYHPLLPIRVEPRLN